MDVAGRRSNLGGRVVTYAIALAGAWGIEMEDVGGVEVVELSGRTESYTVGLIVIGKLSGNKTSWRDIQM